MARFRYSQGGKQYGPVSGQELKRLALSGQLYPNAIVSQEGLPMKKHAQGGKKRGPNAAYRTAESSTSCNLRARSGSRCDLRGGARALAIV